jgi:hypothetical protein
VLRTRDAAGDPLPPKRGVKESFSFAERTYRMRVYEHISNASLRAYIESSAARYIDDLAPSARDMCFARDMRFARDMPPRRRVMTQGYAEQSEAYRAERSEAYRV